MDRELLLYFLNSGPTRKFDVLALSRAISPTLETGKDYLFKSGFLNRAIIFKFVDLASPRQSNEYPIRTLIYMPYDVARPGDGGESFVYSRANFLDYVAYRSARREVNEAGLARDRERLDILDRLPTLNPFILEQAFQRESIAVPDAYLNLDEAFSLKIRERLKLRIRPLIVAAVEGGGEDLGRAIDDLATKFLYAKSAAEIGPLIQALNLAPDEALEVISAWAGITYFEEEYVQAEPQLKAFAQWLARYPMPREFVAPDEKELLVMTIRQVKAHLRDEWNRSLSILKEYQNSYRELLDHGRPGAFVDFLHRSPGLYWQLGDLLGRLEQTIYAWQTFTRPYPEQALPFAVLNAFYSVLRQAHPTTGAAEVPVPA